MRRLAFAAAVCGTIVLSACNDQTPTEPAVPQAENFGTHCGPLVLTGPGGIVGQINSIYAGTSRTQTLLRVAALAQAGVMKLLWDTCHPAVAKKVAFVFIDWLNRHTPAGKEAQVQTLILAILSAVGEVDPASGGDFGVGFFDPASPDNTVITTLNHHALIQLEPGSFLVPTEIVISRRPGDPPLTDFTGNQYPPTYDYNAINSTNNHVLQPGKTAIVAFCLVYIGPPNMPGNGYAANLGIGHNPVVGAPGYPFEILDPFDLEGSVLRADLNCPGNEIGSLGSGLQNFADAALRTAGSFLLPQPLWAATLGTLPPPPPLGGRAPSLSPFRPVQVSSNRIQEGPFNFIGPEDGNTVGVPLNSCSNDGCPVQFQVLDGESVVTTPTSLTVTLIQGAGSTGVLGGTTTRSTGGYYSTADFNDLTVSQPGSYQLRVTSEGMPPYTTGVFTVAPAAPVIP